MKVITPKDIPSKFNIGIAVARFHENITHKLLDGALQRFQALGFASEQITTLWVPGAVELPIAAQRLAQTENYAAIICFGAVIYGETKHFDYVCQQVSQGCQQVALVHDIPVIFGVLTTDTLEQAIARAGGTKGNMGEYAADSAFELVSVLEQLEQI